MVKRAIGCTTIYENNRTYVPIRFIAETFGSQVHYNQGTVNITTEPLLIEDEKSRCYAMNTI